MTFNWRMISWEYDGVRWGYDGRRWDTLEDVGIRWITTLVLKICKNLLDARRTKQTFAPPPPPRRTHVRLRLWKTFVRLWITLLTCGKLVDNFY